VSGPSWKLTDPASRKLFHCASGTILSDRNRHKYNSAPFRQAKTDLTLVRDKPDRKLGSDDAWFVHWWAVRYPVWEVTELEASSSLNMVKKPFQGQEHSP
jgi:hypothetical protein